jgi:hypothetical protein
MWHANMNQQSTLAVLIDETTGMQENWDLNDRKAYTTIISSLTEALQKRYDEIDETGSSNVHYIY